VAVVYAVMVETGLNRTEIGNLILAACFVNALGTALAELPWLTRIVIRRWGGRVSEPEVKFLFLVLCGLGGWPPSPAARRCCRRISSVSSSRERSCPTAC
jgi:hypothetical protein